MMRSLVSFCALAIVFAVFAAASLGEMPLTGDAATGKNVVLWISVDGFRGDYVDRGKSPFIRKLMEHGLYSRELMPVFPSLTFPSHVSEVTGVLPGVHGIISNKYLDTITGEEFNMSTCPQALRAEPIWFTATRQGVRTAVIDWPLSGGQEQLPAGTLRTACFTPGFDTKLTDRERLDLLVDKYRADAASANPDGPLRLLMGYGCGIDKAGHEYGPKSQSVDAAIAKMDATLEAVVTEVAAEFEKQMDPAAGDALWVLLTTDHGMCDVEHVVSIRHLMGGDEVPEPVYAATSGNLAHIYFHRLPASQREAERERVFERLQKVPFAKVWRREDLPAKWGYDAPGRTGDLVFSMDRGYVYSWKDGVTIEPVTSDPEYARGMHGYDPAENPEMLGCFVLSRWGATTPGRDAGPIDSLCIHPTVAKLLGVEPAEGATAKPLDVQGR
jgi:predicted AlkP superfamily pyrophosphatase or phosphodiesterase